MGLGGPDPPSTRLIWFLRVLSTYGVDKTRKNGGGLGGQSTTSVLNPPRSVNPAEGILVGHASEVRAKAEVAGTNATTNPKTTIAAVFLPRRLWLDVPPSDLSQTRV